MGLFKRIAANHRANVAQRQKRKESKREHKTARKEAKYDHRNARQLDRLLHHDGRVHARLEKRGSSIADQDERDVANAFPVETQTDPYNGGYDAAEGSQIENTELTPFAQYDHEPGFVQFDYDTTDLGSFDEDSSEGDYHSEDDFGFGNDY